MFKKKIILASIVLSGSNLINGCGKCGVTFEALAKKLVEVKAKAKQHGEQLKQNKVGGEKKRK